MAVITVIGSLFFIFLENPIVGFVVLTSIVPICLIVYSLYKKIAQGTKVAHSHYEQKISILTEGDDTRIETFFNRRRKILIYQSTIQGKNWTALNLTKGTFVILSIIIFTHSNVSLSQGQAVSMYAYVNQFLMSIMSIPIGVEMFTRLKDIVNRIKE
jgi:hypothetical protein